MSMHGETPVIVDCGCGSGRDSLFFAQQRKDVFGLDASHEAVRSCRARAAQAGLGNTHFEQLDFTDPMRVETVATAMRERALGRPVLVYARFLIHALDEDGQKAFLNFARALCGSAGQLAVEFRTHRDQHQEKATDAHYRRYVDPISFVLDCGAAGFSVRYHVEGFGMAIYRNDDAHVYRGLLALG